MPEITAPILHLDGANLDRAAEPGDVQDGDVWTIAASGLWVRRNGVSENLRGYSENTFTPVLKFGGASTGITYGTQTGRYERHGNQVTVGVNVILTNKGSATGNAVIEGLPFAMWNDNAQRSIAIIYYAGMSGIVAPFIARLTPGTSSGLGVLLQMGDGTGAHSAGVVDDTNFTNTSQIQFHATYRAVA